MTIKTNERPYVSRYLFDEFQLNNERQLSDKFTVVENRTFH